MNLNLGRRDRRTQEMSSSSLPASLFLLSVVFWQFVAAADPVTVKAKVGADVTLPCKTAGDKAIVQAEWSRPDQTSAPVLLYKNNKVDDNQLAAYKGRTSLLDVQKRDLSLVLKKVVGKDAGKYECRVELGEGTAAAGGGTRGGAGGGGTATGGAGGGGTATGGAAAGGAAAGGAAAGGAEAGGAAAGGAEAGGAEAGGAEAGGAEAGGAEAFDASGGRGRSRARGRVLKSDPISIVILTVEEQIYIKATTGLDVTLPCRVPANNPIQVVEWSRAGLGSKFVLLFKDGMMDKDQQHPSFKDRVELLDSNMKGGDVSIVLKKVHARDSGQFECRVIQMAPANELRRNVYLYIAPLPVPEQANIKVTTGLDVTLPCSDPDYNPIQVVQWSRPSLGPKFVLLFKDGMIDEDEQHPSFKGRVELLDFDMKDGDVSMILKKVQASDAGIFECRVIQMAHGEELRRRVYLDVVEPFPAWVIVVAVLLSLCLTVSSVLVYKNRHHFTPASWGQEEDEDDESDEYGEYDEYDDMKMDSHD